MQAVNDLPKLKPSLWDDESHARLKQMKISIHIERLVLDGVEIEHRDRPLLQSAVETELARLITRGGLSPDLMSGGATPRVNAGDLQMTGDNNPARLGRQIAQSVYGGIGNEGAKWHSH